MTNEENKNELNENEIRSENASDTAQTPDDTSSKNDDILRVNKSKEISKNGESKDDIPCDNNSEIDGNSSKEPETPDVKNSQNEDPVTLDDPHDQDRFDTILEANDSWKKVKRPPKLTKTRTLLIAGVLIGVPWLVSGYVGDLAYFFSGWTPQDLGKASDYVRGDAGHSPKPQNFKDNTYVSISGYPVRQIAIKKKEGVGHVNQLVYQLMGSSIYVQEPLEDSKYAQFLSSTQSAFNPDAGVSNIEVSGRLRRFDTGNIKSYGPVRDYYEKQYGVTFCSSITKSERTRRQAQLGQGGLSLQVMPDNSVIKGETNSTETIRKVIPLKGRSALAIGDHNMRFVTQDAGLTWNATKLPFEGSLSSVAYMPSSGQVIYASRGGRIGAEDYRPDPEFIKTSQDVEDIIFTDHANVIIDENHPTTPQNAPALIAVGREGLIQLAFQNQEGWHPALLEKNKTFNDIIRIQDTFYVAGTDGALLTRKNDMTQDLPWSAAMTPASADWYGLLELPDYVVATGSNGLTARLDRTDAQGRWQLWPFDDVPGIEFTPVMKRSAVSGDGKTWVAVGEKGAILNAHRGEDGSFGRISAISNSFSAYGFLDDLAADVPPTDALANAIARHTDEDLYDVTWNHGQFFAVGDNGLLMTSPDGHTWQKRPLHIQDKRLRTIKFVSEKQGYIGGEAGTLLITQDGGLTWNSMQAPTKRSIYKIVTDPSVKNAFIFTGAYGLWGYCYTDTARCFLRSTNQDHHYHAITLAQAASAPNKMYVVASGSNGTIEAIDDSIGPKSLHPIINASEAIPADIAAADMPLPLKPNYGGGQLVLIASTNGTVYRSTDAGYTFHPQATGLTGDIKRVLLSQNGDAAYALSSDGDAVRAMHGLREWKPVTLPDNHKIIDATLIGTTAALASTHCIYTLTSSDDAQPTERACIPDAKIIKTARFGASQLAFMTDAGDAYALDPSTTAEPQKLAASLRNIINSNSNNNNDNNSHSNTSSNPINEASDRTVQTQQFFGCDNTLWFAHNDVLYKMQGDAWSALSLSQPHLVDVVCANDRVDVVTSSSPRPGVWHLDVTQLHAAGSDAAWSMNVGFDPSHARFAHTSDGFWFITAQAQNTSAPLILLSKNGKQWSWRRDRIDDYYAIAQTIGASVVVGNNGSLLISKDQGLSWNQLKTSTKQTLRDVCLSKDGTFGIAVGDAGTILYTKKNLDHWTRSTYKLTTDLTSCTIDETDGRFNVYIAGKDGLFYVSHDRSLARLDLVESASFENIESLATLQSGEVIAVGGNYQDPDSICEEGFLLEDNKTPYDMWPKVLFTLILFAFWLYTLRAFIIAFKHRNDIDEDELSEFTEKYKKDNSEDESSNMT